MKKITNKQIPNAIANMEQFSNAGGSLSAFTDEKGNYHVKSYQTPLALVIKNSSPCMTDKKFSITTSKLTSLVSAGLSKSHGSYTYIPHNDFVELYEKTTGFTYKDY